MTETRTDTTLEGGEHPLILSSRVNETLIFDRSGRRLGHIEDLSIEKASGRVIYAIMSFGGFLGLGEKFHPVPWSMLDYDVGLGGFTVPLDPSVLKDAPSYDREELRQLGGPAHRDYSDVIFRYYGTYGAVPYW